MGRFEEIHTCPKGQVFFSFFRSMMLAVGAPPNPEDGTERPKKKRAVEYD